MPRDSASLVSESARRLVETAVSREDRVLILGATGWFGRSAIDLLSGTGAAVLPIASAARDFDVAGSRVSASGWSEELAVDFDATIVVDCAFLTRDRTADLALQEYATTNRMLTERMLRAARGRSARRVITISSGAAVYPKDALQGGLEANPYGFLKREAEESLRQLADATGLRGIVARAWSVSGAYVQHPRNYALADLILQASVGDLRVRATRPVWRRYVLADELLAVALADGGSGFEVIESGGPLVEMSDLARCVRDAIHPTAAIDRAPSTIDDPDRYHSDGVGWNAKVVRTGLDAYDLRSQIELTARGLGVAVAR